jgi:hypothetical protein
VQPTVTPAPEQPTDTPTAQLSLLAYVSAGQLLVTDVTGGVPGGTTQYTLAGTDDQVVDPVWSPSGEFIAYTSLASTEPHIYFVFAAGAGTPVDLGPGSTPAWSPDSTMLVYQREGNLWLTATESPEPRQITFQENWAWGNPVFLPDGSAAVVAGNSFDSLGASGNTQFGLDVVPLDGSGTLTPLPGMTQQVDGRLPYDLRFSPDGGHLAFSTSFHLSACSAPGDHYVAAADGSNLTTIESPTLAPHIDPTIDIGLRGPSLDWSPAGDALAITGGAWDCSTILSGGEPAFVAGPQLSIVGLDGTEQLVIPGFFWRPSFDRTGAMVAAELGSDTSASRIEVHSTSDGSLLLDVGEGSEAVFQP